MQNKMPRLVRNVLAAAVVIDIPFAAQAADKKIGQYSLEQWSGWRIVT